MISSIDFGQASLYRRLSDACWDLQAELSVNFVGYELLVELLIKASLELDENFKKYVGYADSETISD